MHTNIFNLSAERPLTNIRDKYDTPRHLETVNKLIVDRINIFDDGQNIAYNI